MTKPVEDFLFDDARSDAERHTLRTALEEDPELARAFRHWQVVQITLRQRLNDRIPDRTLLVLFALDEDGAGSKSLTASERARLATARADLEEALQAHPALQDVVQQIRRERDAFESTWEAHLGTGSRHGSSGSEPADTAAGGRARSARAARRSTGRQWAWRIAVGTAVIVFGLALFFILQRDLGMVTAETGPGETRTIELASGSSVLLGERSRLTYVDPASGPVLGNQARLEGQAYFDLAPAPQGFVVETPTARATVLGTRFSVQADAEETEVVLAEGRLSLAPAGAYDQVVVLEEGQRSRVARNARPTTPAPADVTEALAWTGFLVFLDTPLSEIADRLRRQYDVEIQVAPALREERVTGTFDREQSVEEVLRVLAATLGAEVRGEEARFVIEPSGT